MRFTKMLLIFLLLYSSSIWSDSLRQAKKEIAQAVTYYKSGDWKSSGVFFQAAMRKYPVLLASYPDALRLEILFLLAQDQQSRAAKKMEHFVTLQEDPFYLYFLGLHFFKDRQFKLAANYFKKSTILSFKRYSEDYHSQTQAIQTGKFFSEYSLFLCKYKITKRNLQIIAKPRISFSNSRLAHQLWQKEMSKQEIRMAAYYVRVLSPYFKLARIADLSMIPDDTLIDKNIPNLKKRSQFDQTTNKLLLHPLDSSHNNRCIKNLEYQLQENLNGVYLRPSEKLKINDYIYNIHLNRMFLQNDSQSRFYLVDFLIKYKKNLEALHALGSIPGRNRIYLLTNKSDYYLLKKIFEYKNKINIALGWNDGRTMIKRMLNILEKYRSFMQFTDSKKINKDMIDNKIRNKMIQEMVDVAGENRNLVESLEFLIQHHQYQSAYSRQQLLDKLKQIRDKRENLDYPAAFRFYYYAGK